MNLYFYHFILYISYIIQNKIKSIIKFFLFYFKKAIYFTETITIYFIIWYIMQNQIIIFNYLFQFL